MSEQASQQNLLDVDLDAVVAEGRKQNQKNKKVFAIVAGGFVAVIIGAVLITNVLNFMKEEAARKEAYNVAIASVEHKEYVEAIKKFTELGNYKDSKTQVKETTYKWAVDLANSEDYGAAMSAFEKLGDYKDSELQAKENAYKRGVAYLKNEEYGAAGAVFEKLGDYKDSVQRREEAELGSVIQELMPRSISEAYEKLNALPENYEWKQELKSICEPYIAYCGKFIGIEDGEQITLTSDFLYRDYTHTVFWKYESSRKQPMTLYLVSGKDKHTFLPTGKTLKVDSNVMAVLDEWRGMTGRAQFADGNIHITVSNDSEQWWDCLYERTTD